MVLKGRGATDGALRQAIMDARQAGFQVTVSVTWEEGDATRFAQQAAADGVDVVVAAGGDGTINEVVQGVLTHSEPSNCAVGVIPMGTANDFAANAGVPVDDPQAALQLILDSEPKPIDVGLVNDRIFVNVASGGIGAEIVSQTPSELKEMLGGVSYSLTGLASILTMTPNAIRVEGPDFEWEGESLVLIVGNARTAGGGYVVAPDAQLDDGMLDVMIVPRIAAQDFFRFVGQLLEWNNNQNFDDIVRRQIPWLRVHADDGLSLNVDGEPTEGRDFHFKVCNRCLPFHLP
jgi:lipid kinase YegS